MDKPFDLKVIEFKNKIVEEINKSELPITVLSIVMHEIVNVVDAEQQKVIASLLAEQNKKENKEEE